MTSTLDILCINTIRFLAADAVQNADSGHPGLPMGAAAMAYSLWDRHLKHNPTNPGWVDRDRFVLSAGHGSMLLYALLHLTGYDLSLDEIKRFRQWGSLTPGHPESHLTPGVETTTGPLGQGISNAVGMAIAEAHLAAIFNRPDHQIVDHFTYVLAGDGDLMEGVAAEACSLAGHLGLGKLIVLYDSNNISLAGTTSLTFTEKVDQRFAAYGWHVLHVRDGNDPDEVQEAIAEAKETTDRPSLIIVPTQIGYGSPGRQGSYHAHGSPLGTEELRLAKENLGWPVEPYFHLPAEAVRHFRLAVSRGRKHEEEWLARFEGYARAHPSLAGEFTRRMSGQLPAEWDSVLPQFPADPKGLATRKASEKVMASLTDKLPELIGGSADLNPSTYTWLKGLGDFQNPHLPDNDVQGRVGGDWGYTGRNLHFGVREHAMTAIVNGLALHRGLIPYGATFLVFSDYMRPSLRLSAIMKLQTIWICTHDGIGVGEDGPTHQAVEQYAALRAIPDLLFFRPCDANETAWAWRAALMNRHRPSLLALTRQSIPTLDRAQWAPASGVLRGAYVLNPGNGDDPDLLLLASGSEVHHALEAAKLLDKEGIHARVVSMPCWELFEEQPEEYRESVLPGAVGVRIAIETGVSLGWHKWVGPQGVLITLDHFGASAPGSVLMDRYGFTPENIAVRARRLIENRG